MKFATKVIHGGVSPDPSTGAIMTPVYQSSTFAFASPGRHRGFEYSRVQNPTRLALENNLAILENGQYGLTFSSGVAAIDAVVRTLRPGGEVIAPTGLYGGSFRLFSNIFTPLGIKFHYTPMDDLGGTERLINRNTKMIWVETPTNPLLHIIDLGMISKLSKSHGLLFVVDNTFASPYLQNPLDFGADIVVHSATKYLNGHSDVILGAVIVNDEKLHNTLRGIQVSAGAVPGPQDCFLTLRGIKTLHLRMQRHCENAKAVAMMLRDHPKIKKVQWPGLQDHPGHEIAKRQMKDFGGMVSFSFKDDTKETAFRFMENLQLFTIAESLGGVESLCGHSATMSHATMSRETRIQAGITDSLIRLSVGVEDASDLVDDLGRALDRV